MLELGPRVLESVAPHLRGHLTSNRPGTVRVVPFGKLGRLSF
jgi:hypothetical protein